RRATYRAAVVGPWHMPCHGSLPSKLPILQMSSPTGNSPALATMPSALGIGAVEANRETWAAVSGDEAGAPRACLDTGKDRHLESDRPVGRNTTGRNTTGGPPMSVALDAPPLLRDQRLTPIWDKVKSHERLTRDDGLALFDSDDLHGVGRI